MNKTNLTDRYVRSESTTCYRPKVTLPKTVLVANLASLLAFSACMESRDVREITATKQALETTSSSDQASDQQFLVDGTSPGAVSVFWDNRDETRRANVLGANIKNNTGNDIKVSLTVLANGPTGSTVTRSLGSRLLKANETQILQVPIGSLPIQSVGVSTSVTIIASYPGASVDVTGKTVTAPTIKTFASHRHVTFDADFSQVTIRTARAQAEANAPQYDDDPGPRLTAQRVLDNATGAMKQTAAASGSDSSELNGVITLVALPPGVGPDNFLTYYRPKSQE